MRPTIVCFQLNKYYLKPVNGQQADRGFWSGQGIQYIVGLKVASISKYNNTSYGNGTDRVYGQYMCLDYVPYDTCQACISAASQAIVNLCRNRTEAVVWEEYCQLRYSDINFFGRLNVADNFFQDNVINISDPVHFQSIVENKLRDLTKRAAFNSSANMYAAGGEPYTGDDTLYAMVQCTRDLSPDNCSKCLEAAIKDVSSECYASRGARLLSRSCYLRYELYAFYEGAEDSSVSTKKEGGGGRKTWMIVVLTIGSAVLVILLLASTIYCVARKKGTGKGKEKILRNQMQIHNIGDPENTDLQNHGYMAPEYAMEGLYSIKSDVFSFGVLLLEIITGRRNAGFHQSKRVPSLVAYAWHLWNEGNALELMDPLLTDGCPDEFLRFIHIGLLCVEEDAFNRPSMPSVVVMLKGETVTLSQPQQPAFSVRRLGEHHQTQAQSCSVNGLTISNIEPR
ncbi:hypothetical protein SCA6_020346 [Theobroma cacao]